MGQLLRYPKSVWVSDNELPVKLQSLLALGNHTASQTGGTDQTTHSNSTAHPESCQLASPKENTLRKKAHQYSVLKQHISSLQAKGLKDQTSTEPSSRSNAIGHVKDPMKRTTTTGWKSTT
jgi:hypothetical protein